MSNVPGLFVIGEANFSDHGANRLGASALMQGLADGYFVFPNTLPNYLAGQMGKRPSPESPEFEQAEQSVRARLEKLLKVNGTRRPIRSIASLAFLLWDKCGMSRNEQGLREALRKIPELRDEFWHDVRVPGDRRRLQPITGTRRARRGFPRIRRADVP
jgi:Succinate dehydrogenase/fumarate reductase, flavoprotein subunit